MSDDLNNETPAVPLIDGVALFDPSTLTPSDVPYIGPEPDEITPDHTASADVPPEDAPARAGKRRGIKRDKPAKEPPPKQRPGALVRPLTEMYTSIGLMVAPFDPVCSTVILDNARKCAESLDALARENDAVRRAIMALTATSAWGGLVIAHLPVLLVLMAHHGPREVSERVSPLAAMMSPSAAAAQAAAAATARESA